MYRNGGSPVQAPQYGKTRENGVQFIDHFCGKLKWRGLRTAYFELITYVSHWSETSVIGWWSETSVIGWWSETSVISGWSETSVIGWWSETCEVSWWSETSVIGWWSETCEISWWSETCEISWWSETFVISWWLCKYVKSPCINQTLSNNDIFKISPVVPVPNIYSHSVYKTQFNATFQCRAVICGICDGQSGTWRGFYRRFSILSVSVIPPVLHVHSLIYVINLEGC